MYRFTVIDSGCGMDTVFTVYESASRENISDLAACVYDGGDIWEAAEDLGIGLKCIADSDDLGYMSFTDDRDAEEFLKDSGIEFGRVFDMRGGF